MREICAEEFRILRRKVTEIAGGGGVVRKELVSKGRVRDIALISIGMSELPVAGNIRLEMLENCYHALQLLIFGTRCGRPCLPLLVLRNIQPTRGLFHASNVITHSI